MPPNIEFLEVEKAFQDRPDLKRRLCGFLNEHPTHHDLIRDVSSYVIELKSDAGESVPAHLREYANKVERALQQQPAAGAASKKRKRESDGPEEGAAGGWADAGAAACFSTKDVSFSIPQRKKLTLELVALVADKSNHRTSGIRVVGADGNVEFGIAWANVEQIMCLPIPEKAKRQHNFVVIPRCSNGVMGVPESTRASEPIVWNSPEPSKKELKNGQQDCEPMRTVHALDGELARYGKKVIFPDAGEFVSSIPQSHFKGEKGYHVKAFKGSKDGFLFFLSVGILWAFKKPLGFFSLDCVSSVSYTSILQRTFNLNVSIAGTSESQKGQELEFSMLDQADYAGIDAYVKKHGLQDASMAEQRRAKRANVNGPPARAENGDGGNSAAAGVEGEDEESELQKAERLLQDQEDEMEEDYEPGSEGESEGSGTGDEEEGYDDGGGEGVAAADDED